MPFDFGILPNQRVAVMGMTGSGKTFFCRALLSGRPRLIVLDPKGLLNPRTNPKWNLELWDQGIRRMEAGKAARLYIPPPLDDSEYEDWFDQILRLRNVTVYIDELYGVGPASGSKGLRALFTRGRELGIGVYACFQRPRWIPMYSLSEAEWKIVFRLEMQQDKDYVASMAFGRFAYYPLQEHGFMIKDPDGHIQVLTHGVKVVTGPPLDSKAR